jgi:hypothetical protein
MKRLGGKIVSQRARAFDPNQRRIGGLTPRLIFLRSFPDLLARGLNVKKIVGHLKGKAEATRILTQRR